MTPDLAVLDALGAVYSGATEQEARAFMDQLRDRGFRIERERRQWRNR